MLRYGYLDDEAQIETFTSHDFVESSGTIVKKSWMDTKCRNSFKEIAEATLRIMSEIEAFNPDLVMLGDDSAANYVGNQLLDTKMPVVFWGINGLPIKYGLVDSMDRPGHNVTGVWQTGYQKESLELLHRLVPWQAAAGQRHRSTASSRISDMALRSIVHSFGGSIQDEEGRIVLDSPQTLEAVKFVKTLYQNAMTEEVLTWDPSSNNRMMLSGQGSLALNAISITRTGESQKIPVANRIWLAEAAKGPERRIGLIHLMHVYVIWKFARNIEGAKKFLVDYISYFRDAFLASKFYNLPCFPNTVPDLESLVKFDPIATPDDKYAMLADVPNWTTAVDYPGYANAVVDETVSSWVISRMFADAAHGRETPSDAVKAAHTKIVDISKKMAGGWKGIVRLVPVQSKNGKSLLCE